MGTIPLADEFLLLEIEGALDQFDPFLELDALEMIDVEDAGSRPSESARWGYRVPCPGVRYYFYESASR